MPNYLKRYKIKNMFEEIDFVKTDDESIGLYDKKTGDIFHAKQGALTESVEKFVKPVSGSFKTFNSEPVKVLDICYGVGYNSKSFLSSYINLYSKINFDVLDINNELIFLSPFIEDCIIDDDLKLFIIKNIIKDSNDIKKILEILSYIYKYKFEILSSFGTSFYQFLNSGAYTNIPLDEFRSDLHNIYYKYISNSMNNKLSFNRYKDCSINVYCSDARKSIKLLNSKYDIVFLDGFSPKKDPTLWTIDFLSLIKSKIKDDGLLISYSKSTPFRSALTELGFSVGKNISNYVSQSDNGTIASLNSAYIQNPLTDYDFQIISSTSGIPYRDPDFKLSSIQILNNRDIELRNSERISRSQTDKNL